MEVFFLMQLSNENIPDRQLEIIREKAPKAGLEIIRDVDDTRKHCMVFKGDIRKARRLLKNCPKTLCGLRIARLVTSRKSL